MHKSAYEIGAKFLERYWVASMKRILEVGAIDVNGSLKDFKPKDCEWVGVDLEHGKGVDIVVERASRLPFENDSFDLVVATSIFEHDPTFWLTFNEMLRVAKPSGFIYVCAPSNGLVHRYPMDAYRFYPDAGIGLVEWGRRENSELQLVESFISERDGDVWNDFCAVFSKTKSRQVDKIYPDTPCSNVWSDGVFLDHTLLEATEDMRIIENLKEDLTSTNPYIEVQARLKNLENLTESILAEITDKRRQFEQINNQLEDSLKNTVSIGQELLMMRDSISWRITSPLRSLNSWIKRR
jgi:SAM-dependent methyltransferase